ncbi:2,5-didehydrogluconate reductase DkgB [Aliiglaciecola litoralis]|uniref:2,5-didehydrogluconate reductase DkgB n=1 Tax=Aliiglaciecola litoralis TaxID=582857 RepID=A0ABN1LRY9_9ALTE
MYQVTLPSPGFGTFRLEGESLKQAITDALEIGFRHIDTAQIYGNEETVGEAIANSSVKRDDIFLTTKVWFDNFNAEKFVSSVEESLDKLQTDYVDLLLIHWPSPDRKVPIESYLKSLVDCMHKGYTRAIGLSNFTAPLLEEAFSVIGKENIACNQVEVHPYFQNTDLVKFCQRHDITVVGYMPLGNGKIMEDKVLNDIADEHGVSVASVALAWQLQQGLVPIPASTNKAHIESNFAAKELRLTPDEMDRIAKLDTGKRFIDPDFSPDW